MNTGSVPDSIASELLALQLESPVMVFLFDAEDRLRFANAAFRNCFAIAPDAAPSWAELMTRSFTEKVGALIETANLTEWLASARSRRGKEPYRAFETDMCDGRWMWLTETMRPDGWMLCIASDITHLKSSGRALRYSRDLALRSAQTDALTGISNRAHVMQQLEQRLEQVRQRNQQCGIALIDLDDFKQVNDKYGHTAGDAVLKHFAQTVQATLRREDGFGRLGGEEFLLLFPRIDHSKLEHIITRILKSLHDSRPLREYPSFFYTGSAGLGILKPEDTASSAYRRVDEAMYAAKSAGRNGFRWAI
jgi:diguanylate cyclase (GGDEF)-like protein